MRRHLERCEGFPWPQHLACNRTVSTLLLFLFLSGCSARSTLMEAPLPGENIQVIDADGLAQFVDQHRGKVVLIDFWATWCPPCVQLFPHTVELHKRWAQRGLVVAAISLDDPSDESAVRRFLTEKGADFPNFISRFGPSGRSAEEFNIAGGGIPYLHVYDRQGKPLKTFGGDKPVDPQEIDQAVEEALSTEERIDN